MKKNISLIFLLFSALGFTQDYYVATNGSSGNSGTSSGSPWSLRHMETKINDGTVSAGNEIAVKAGNYGDIKLILTRGGTESQPIKIKGYTTTPNDINTTTESTYSYGDAIVTTILPTITNSGNGSSGNGIWLRDDYIWIENFQIRGYKENVNMYAVTGLTLKNIVSLEGGVQESDIAGGRGIIIRGNNHLIENCFDLNATGQGITLTDASNCTIRNCEVYSDNEINPGGYYIVILKNSYDNLVEGSTIWRKRGLFHGGHGLIIKDLAERNTFRNCTAYHTGIEVNFSGVKNNLYENITIYGENSLNGNFANCIRIGSGPSNNTFRNILLDDVRYGIEFRNNNDGPAPTAPSTNADEGGHDNIFENIIVNKAQRLISYTRYASVSSASINNEFRNITAYDIIDTDLINNSHTITGTTFKNISVSNAASTNFLVGGGSISVSNSNFFDNDFTAPSGTAITTLNPLYVNAPSGDFNLQASSPLIDSGTAITGLTFDFNNNPRVVNSTIDIGAIEYQGVSSPDPDTTAPTITEVAESLITETSIQVEFRFNEGSTGRIEWGTTLSYGNLTTLEPNFLTFHRQNITGLSAGTLYNYRILGEDAAGNDVVGANRTATTLGSGENPDPPPNITEIQDNRGLFLKSKKLF